MLIPYFSSRRTYNYSAGVLGLSSAVICQEHFSTNVNMIILARDLPGDESIDYASPWSGAHYRPIPDVTPQGILEASLAKRTYEYFKSYGPSNPDSSILFLKGTDLLEVPAEDYVSTAGRYKDIDDFRVLAEEELPVGVGWGANYRTWCVNPSVYLSHLLGKYISAGGKVIRKHLSSLDDAFRVANNVRMVINCSGVGFNDPASFATRGRSYQNWYKRNRSNAKLRSDLSRIQSSHRDNNPPKCRRNLDVRDSTSIKRRYDHRRHQRRT